MPGRGALVLVPLALLTAVTVAGATPTSGVQSIPYLPANGPTTMATGDFDGDGHDDLATGVPHEDVSGKSDAGAVHVLYGSPAGIGTANAQLWHQGKSGVPGKLEKNDRFGWALATGDFDKDGYDDLAIGVPFENISYGADCGPIFGCENTATDTNAGYVVVLYGSKTGLAKAGSEGWARNTDGIQGASVARSYFGWALASGDFDGDGFDDLGVGAPGAWGGRGDVHVLFGRSSGLGASRDQLWLQGNAGVDDTRERGDWFGASLAAGNLGYSSREDDLAIGAPGEGLGSKSRAGAVHVLYGQPGKGLTTTLVPDRLLHHDIAGVAGDVQNFGSFGWALAIADFGRSNQADLAVGSPGYLIEGGTGSVSVFYGGSFGVVPAESELWHRGTVGLMNAAQSLRFGHSLAAGDFNGFSQADLAIGTPDAEMLNVKSGAIQVVYGSPLGLRVNGSIAVPPQVFGRRSFSNAQPRDADGFGFGLAAGSFGNGIGADLAVSAPGVDRGDGIDQVDTGELYVAYGRTGGLFRDTAARSVWHQDSDGVEDVAEAGDRLGG
jgi:FG-GAP repeat